MLHGINCLGKKVIVHFQISCTFLYVNMRVLSAHILLKNVFRTKYSSSPLLGLFCQIVGFILKEKTGGLQSMIHALQSDRKLRCNLANDSRMTCVTIGSKKMFFPSSLA